MSSYILSKKQGILKSKGKIVGDDNSFQGVVFTTKDNPNIFVVFRSGFGVSLNLKSLETKTIFYPKMLNNEVK
jgi:hypothetical protein